MCGIAGFTHRNRRPDPDAIRNATRSLVHRGPDQQGVYESAAVSLGAVRLRIIDLEGGDQPMSSDDGGTVIVFNGEVYNYREVRRELESLGHRFRSKSDTEVVLRAFLQWDTACFERLRGMFGAAFWTESRRRLLLARDRIGIKPLYYLRRGEDLYFGSELKAILTHPEIDRRLDHTGLSYYLSQNYVPSPYTLVEGIRKLPPGHWLEWLDGKIRIDSYWRLRFQPRDSLKLADAKEELDALLRESVREHLISDVPLGVWSSGGLDSSTVLHYASQYSGARLKTFSVSFQGRSFDESPYFRETAASYGTDHHEFDLNPDLDLAGAIADIAYYSDEPSADAGALPVWFLAQMSRRHVTVALSGEGADELFAGYYTYLADRYARVMRMVPAPARRLALKALNLWPVSDDKISLEYKLKRFLRGSLLPSDAAHLFWNGAFTEDEKRKLLTGPPTLDQRPPVSALMSRAPQGLTGLNRYLWFDQLHYLPDDILYKCDRMSMAHSLEVRPPFLDHRIVEFAASLPEDLKLRGSRLKYLLKQLMKDKLPASVLTRKKEGFDIPAHDWFRGALKPLLLDTLTREAAEESGIFRWPEVSAVVRSHMERHANLGFHLWGLLTLFLWMKHWRIHSKAVPEESRDTSSSASRIN